MGVKGGAPPCGGVGGSAPDNGRQAERRRRRAHDEEVPMPQATAIRHLAFEDLGALAAPLAAAGYHVCYHDVGVDDITLLSPDSADLLIVLGGPIGAYEDDRYPFLAAEVDLLARRLAAGRSTLGICLGAQLIARALGARVYPAPAKEIGFAPITLTEAGRASCLAPFDGEPVLHWHGDTFDLPDHAVHLAATQVCPHQAFAWGRHALAVQFHPEAGGEGFERWLIGHTHELTAAGVDPTRLRAEHTALAPALRRRAAACLTAWLDGLAT